MRVGVVGLGTIASAVVEGFAAGGHTITVSRRNRENAARLVAQFTNVSVADNQAVVDASDVVFLGMTGDAAETVLRPLSFRGDQHVVSLMADLDFAGVAGLVAPACKITRMIPFPAIAQGGSPILTFGDHQAVDTLFGTRNTVFPLNSEAELTSYLCAQAVLSPAVSMVKNASDWLAACTGDPDKAELFLRVLVGASLLGGSCAPLLQALNTPGGYNQRLRQHMEDAGLAKSLQDGLDMLRS